MRNISVRSLLLALVMLAMSGAAGAQVSVAISIGPPELPVYEQPICPGDGYLWTPGYWAYDYDDADYYWVPGTWVLAPEAGFLWTPGYWGWGGNGFIFYEGYWGPEVGFYGGVSYGYGYFGHGYEGGRWDHDHFYYNRSVNNVDVTVIHNVYSTTVVNNTSVIRVSYNGGSGGINERPTPQEEAAAHQRHIPPVAVQTQHAQTARVIPEQRASVNHGKPAVAATPKPGAIEDRGVVPAKEGGAPYNATARSENRSASNASRPTTAIHPNELPPATRPSNANTGNPKLDQKYQQDQQKLAAKQDQERQKLQQKQDQEHQRLAQQKADDARKQQVEQQHQQQTQQLQQKHATEQQHLQQKQQPPPHQSNPPKETPPPKEKP